MNVGKFSQTIYTSLVNMSFQRKLVSSAKIGTQPIETRRSPTPEAQICPPLFGYLHKPLLRCSNQLSSRLHSTSSLADKQMLQNKEDVSGDALAIKIGISCVPYETELLTLKAPLCTPDSGCLVGDPPGALAVNASDDSTITAEHV